MILLFLLLNLAIVGCDPPKPTPPLFSKGETIVLIGGFEGMVIDGNYTGGTWKVRYVNKDGTLDWGYFHEYELRKTPKKLEIEVKQ
jgi:hypothetical protein